MTDKKLASWRKQIDEIDNEIFNLLAKRYDVVKKVGRHKLENNIPFFDETRRREIITRKIEQAKKIGLPVKFIKNIYKRIHDLGLAIEQDL